jgi:hypothetical protein
VHEVETLEFCLFCGKKIDGAGVIYKNIDLAKSIDRCFYNLVYTFFKPDIALKR